MMLPLVLAPTQPTMDRLIGVNAFIDDPVDRIAPPGGFVREYHNLGWDLEGADHKIRFQPSGAAGGNAWFFDDYYRKLKTAGCEVVPCLQGFPTWAFGASRTDDKPLPPGADATASASYRRHAEHLFQFAARYGARRVPDAALALAPGQPRLSGLGLIGGIEDWNEPDKTWWGRAARFEPEELAAMAGADYDGDQGRMGPGIGVKAADPKLPMAMGGLAGLDLDYLRRMKTWADAHRKGSFPTDAINLHHYASTAGEQGFTKETVALSPEADGLREKMARIVAWRDANLPGKAVWLTEFGYDTNPDSPLYARPLGAMMSEAVQAAWLVRGYLALAAAGVDRAAMFMLRDVDPKDAMQFSSSGLTGPKGDWTPKPSWTAVSTLRNTLKGMRFVADVPSGRDDVRVYRFAGGGGKADVVWCPTSADRRVVGFRWKGRRVVGLDGKETASVGTLTVSETPQIVLP